MVRPMIGRRCVHLLLALVATTLLGTACNGPTGGGGGEDGDGNGNGDLIEPIFPANYRETFTEVRDCRGSTSHPPGTIRVCVNEVGLEAYLADANPLPVGTILVKETFEGLTCDNDEELALWSALRKEEPGFDEEDSDWHWQDVQPDRSVLIDTKARCIGCHRACTDRDYMCTLP